MNEKRYYSQRQGIINPLDIKDLRVAFKSVYENFSSKYYFIKFLGNGVLSEDGIIGNSFEAFCMRELNRSIKRPSMAMFYTEDDLFDVIELLHEHINYPLVVTRSDVWSSDEISSIPEKKDIAQKQFRDEINVYLRQYLSGWELAEEGFIRNTLEESFVDLVDNTAVYGDEVNIDAKIRRAKELYLKRGSSMEDKKAAVREIGDALEFMRTDLKQVIGKDEADIFNILNNFGIRHNNASQRTDFDNEIYLPWMFYIFLSTFDAYVKIENKKL
ncbi:hypothetical protein J2T12_001000 [Paenibacillus anaericanus]|uniref:hypothetical protein n=1 Tax=Paenibacillus anaericanus TaxID=170367 RepID=UPI0027890019|nr:hypothetical protein [Paenibacillus anaericanus]MDQ0087606.1 hypothetical protein [Paenibacillus anaericanus]